MSSRSTAGRSGWWRGAGRAPGPAAARGCGRGARLHAGQAPARPPRRAGQGARQGRARANLGTALHAFTEAVDLGRPLPHVPPPFDRDIAAYQAAMRAVEVSRNYVEKVCVVRGLGVAGTMDRVVRFKQGRLCGVVREWRARRDLAQVLVAAEDGETSMDTPPDGRGR